MTITCINEDGTIHDFVDDWTMFLDGKIGNYDGGFDAITQFRSFQKGLIESRKQEFKAVAIVFQFNKPRHVYTSLQTPYYFFSFNGDVLEVYVNYSWIPLRSDYEPDYLYLIGSTHDFLEDLQL